MKKHQLIVLTTFMLALNVTMAGGRRVGNGGDAITCNGKTEVLDYYEGRVVLGHKGYDFGKESNEIRIARYLISKLDRDYVKFYYYNKRLDSFLNETLFVNKPLVDIPDHGHIFYPSNCSVTQAAIQVSPSIHPSKKRYLIHRATWNSMNAQNKAGLIVHELLYREAIELGHSHSKGVRLANAYLASVKKERRTLNTAFNELTVEVNSEPFSSFNKKIPLKVDDLLNRFFSDKKYTEKEIKLGLSKNDNPLFIARTFISKDEKYFDMHLRDLQYKHLSFKEIRSDEIKNRIYSEQDLVTKAILARQLKLKDFDFKLNLLNKISNSKLSNLSQHIAAAMIVSNIIVIPYEETPDNLHIINEAFDPFMSSGQFLDLINLVQTKFKKLARNSRYYPFSYLTSGLNRLIYLKVLRIKDQSYVRGLRTYIEGQVNSFKPNDRIRFSNYVNLVHIVNEGYFSGGISDLGLSLSFYKFLLKNKTKYIFDNDQSQPYGHAGNVFWNAIAVGLDKFKSPSQVLKACILDRFHRIDKEHYHFQPYCELLASSVRASKDIFKFDLTEVVKNRYLGLWSSYFLSSQHEKADNFTKTLIHLTRNDKSAREVLMMEALNYIINKDGYLKPHILSLLSSSTAISEAIIDGLIFVFDLYTDNIRLSLLKNVFLKQISISKRTKMWLESLNSSKYDKEIRFLAVQILNSHH